MVFGEEDNNKGFCGLLLWCWYLRGLEKEVTLIFQRYVILDPKRRWIGLLKIKIGFVKEATGLEFDSLCPTSD